MMKDDKSYFVGTIYSRLFFCYTLTLCVFVRSVLGMSSFLCCLWFAYRYKGVYHCNRRGNSCLHKVSGLTVEGKCGTKKRRNVCRNLFARATQKKTIRETRWSFFCVVTASYRWSMPYSESKMCGWHGWGVHCRYWWHYEWKDASFRCRSSRLNKLCAEWKKSETLLRPTIRQKPTKEWQRKTHCVCIVRVMRPTMLGRWKMIIVKNRRTSNLFISWTQPEVKRKHIENAQMFSCRFLFGAFFSLRTFQN